MVGTQRQQSAHPCEHGIGLPLLFGHVRRILSRVDRQVERIRVRAGESHVLRPVPLHGRTAAGARVPAFLGRQIAVAHADFVAVIDERHARHGQEHTERHLLLTFGQTRRETRRVVVAGDEAEIPFAADRLILRDVLAEELLHTSAALGTEIAVVVRGVERIVRVPREQVVAVRIAAETPVEVEVHIETGFQGLFGHAPLGHESRLWEFGFDGAEHLLPCLDSLRLVLTVVFDQRVRHIDAESVAAEPKPEAHDVHHRVPRSLRRGRIGGGLPPPVTLRKAVVQCRLAFEEVQDICGVAFAFPADERHRVTFERAVGPDVAVGVLVAFGALAFFEPRMFLAGVPGHKVEQHVDAARMRLAEQLDQIVVGTVTRGDLAVVSHVIPGVLERRVIAGVDP